MSDVHTAASRDDEQAVSLAFGWKRLRTYWWVAALGLLTGAALGLALGLSESGVWRAQAIVYLGQPFSPLGGGQIQSLATSPENVNAIVHSESALRRAAVLSGIPLSSLRSSVAVSSTTTTSLSAKTAAEQLRGTVPLAEISVKGRGAHKVEVAADALSSRVVARISSYVAGKVSLLKHEVASSTAQLKAADARIARAEAEQAALVSNGSPTVEKLLVSANLNSVIATTDDKRTSLQDDLGSAEQLLNLATTVEMGRIVEPAAASKSTARSSASSLLVGALIGLIVGVIAALAAEPIVGRRRRSQAGV